MHESNIAIKNEIAKAVANNMQQKLDGSLLPTIDTNINIDLESIVRAQIKSYDELEQLLKNYLNESSDEEDDDRPIKKKKSTDKKKKKYKSDI